MRQFTVNEIGHVLSNEEGFVLKIDSKFILALTGLDGFSHLKIIWWFDEFDSPEMRSIMQTEKPYKDGPETLGMFATRSPIRPNLLAISVSQVLHIDYENGLIYVDWIDANPNTPILDIKPYTPSEDFVSTAVVPEWCASWPKSREESGEFDWENVFNF